MQCSSSICVGQRWFILYSGLDKHSADDLLMSRHCSDVKRCCDSDWEQITAHKSDDQTFSLFIHSFAVMRQCWRSGWAYTTLGEVKKKVVFLSNMAARCPARRLNNLGLASWSHLSTCLSFTPKLLFRLQTSRIPPEFWNSGWLIILGFFIGLLVVQLLLQAWSQIQL